MPQQPLWTIWGVLLGSLGVYGAVPFLLRGPAAEPPPPEGIFVGALTLVGVLTGIATLVIRRVALVRPVRSGALDLWSKSGAARFFTVCMLTWVLSDSVGVYGLVLFVFYRRASLLYSFLAAAVLLLLVHAPRRSGLERGAPADLARPDVKIG